VSGLAPAVEEVTVIFPWYVPDAKPAGFTATVAVVGVALPAVVTESQDPPDAVAVIV